MTARSKKRRNRNSRIKRERNKVKELNTLKRTLGGKTADELMEICADVVDEKTAEELKIVRITSLTSCAKFNCESFRNKQRS